jgi:thiosulfate/3-mercaptopyruvate sulfurtransferase
MHRYGTLLDSRSADAYNGALDNPRTGHIPHAIHAHSAELLGPRRALGGHEVGAYCGGISSSALVFVGPLLGQR